jgi:hypothetical protein
VNSKINKEVLSSSHVEEEISNENKLVLLPGYAYYAMIFCAGGILILVLAPLIATWGEWHLIESLARDMIIIMFGVFLFFLIMVFKFRSPRVLIINENSISLNKGTKRFRVILWENIKNVCYGEKHVTKWIWVPSLSHKLIISDKRGKGNIVVDELLFRIPHGSLKNLISLICQMAKERSIPVYEIKKRMPRFLKN